MVQRVPLMPKTLCVSHMCRCACVALKEMYCEADVQLHPRNIAADLWM
jgi:hypothetical protein